MGVLEQVGGTRVPDAPGAVDLVIDEYDQWRHGAAGMALGTITWSAPPVIVDDLA
jgi:hypothetical protein